MANNKISLKHAPKVTDSTVQLALNRVYDHINEIINSVNKDATDSESSGDGKAGDIRVVTKSNNDVVLEVRTQYGWFETTTLTMIERRG